MATDKTAREGRFADYGRGDAVYKGYRDAVKDDPYDKKFFKRNFERYDTLKEAGLDKNLQKLKNLSDVELEAIAAKAVINQSDYAPKPLNTRLNRKKYNIKQAKRVMARRAAGQPVRKQVLQRTKAARAHIRRVQRNRKLAKTPLYPNLPKGF